ncbi:hypothetical protein HMPREF1022_00204 [Desulfovibrio sp. 6_1_46AFAA]|uniref:pyrimidine dimer DNA glycosylase/endonuclease V n=2 Tax=unclassified Desulfovibrio TaxID=2593640 RepID=UPI0001E126BD|nr:pyrimidine dimer DNA glycosylase/endonuclease V [Desulfovibrio sp. 6_1_46AFAA]EFL85585.1 hypothetical protein HMPREF0326_01288 [Desulfovibrio sp. 3_1_syn3]EGW52852.1 hypothetical protein HMPREF1022_00204 [Desulfovibrio sp. 6_1_46AFAA]
MRMWLVPPSHMCRKHLLGEHVELHMLLGTLKKGKSITGFLSGGLIDPCRMYKRHGELVREMERRGYAHNSPLTEEECTEALRDYDCSTAHIDINANALELRRRCRECARLIPPEAVQS